MDIAARWKKPALVLLVGYWLLLIVATHIPTLPPVLRVQIGDSHLHFMAYFVLAVLFVFHWSLRRTLSWRHYLAAILLLSVFGAIDELTQIPFGRSCELADWRADVTGTVVGVAIFALGWEVYRRGRA